MKKVVSVSCEITQDGVHLKNVMMTFDEYQTAAASTALYPKEMGLAYTALGLAGEAGEIANKVKKVIRGDSIDREALKKDLAEELSDCLWYCAMLAKELGFSLNTVAEMNVKKLADRAARGQIKGTGDHR